MLNKGPSYCLENKPSLSTYKFYINDFIRKLQWSIVYKRNFLSGNNRFGVTKSHNWVSKKLINSKIKSICSKIYNSSLKILSSYDNSNNSINLKQDNIIFTVADKGSNWVIQSVNNYNNEANSQLSSHFYNKIENPKHKRNYKSINHLVNYLYSKKFINLREKRFLTTDSNYQIRSFYLLPKIHKNKWSIPNIQPLGRPIVNCKNSESYNISRFIDYFLQPIVIKSKYFIQDTFSFISKIKNLCVNNNSYLVTIDIKSLYTNIPIDGAINSITQLFKTFPDASRPDNVILNLLKIILYNNDFYFNNEYFLQKKGVAMGQCFAPSVANLYLFLWENQLSNLFNKFPIIWYRYIDDIFCIWESSIDNLHLFINFINNLDANIQVTFNYNITNVVYLDLIVYKSNNKLNYKVYFKDTNSHTILNPTSNHPKHIFKGVVYSQIRRWASLCSNRNDFNESCDKIFPIWKSRGYTKTLLKNTKFNVLQDLNLVNSWQHKFSYCNSCNFKDFLFECNTYTINNLSYTIIGNFSCLSINVIYLIFCNKCNIYYVGQTTNFHERLYKHLELIKNKCSQLVHKHFHSICNINNFKIFIIDSAKTVNKLKIKERNYIKKFKTRTPLGLNVVENYDRKPTLILPFNKTSFKICSNIKSICKTNNITVQTVYKQGKSLRQHLK